MAEGLHIDTDWKKQAQEEKRKLAEKAQQEQQAKPAAAAAPVGPAGVPVGPAGARAARGQRGGQRELPPASIGTLAQSLMTQVLYYLTDIAYQGGDPVQNLDMAKHNIDTLAVLDEKTKDRLTPDEQQALDVALHQSSSRFVSVASQFV